MHIYCSSHTHVAALNAESKAEGAAYKSEKETVSL